MAMAMALARHDPASGSAHHRRGWQRLDPRAMACGANRADCRIVHLGRKRCEMRERHRRTEIGARIAHSIGSHYDDRNFKTPSPSAGRAFSFWLSPTKKDLEMNRLVLSTQSSSAGLGYVQHGTGPECVLVMHDWLGDHSNYDAAIPYLDGTRFTYVFVDLRGYGLSMQLSGAYTVEEIAADCLDLADRLGWQRFHLVGHSMTGMATQRIAADAPSRIKSAIAVCPISAAGNRLSPEALAFFTTTGDSDDAFRRLVKYVTGGLSDRWADFKLRQNRAMIAPECRSGGIPKHARTGELCRRHSRARHAISDHRGR